MAWLKDNISKPEPWFYLMLVSVALLVKGEIKILRFVDVFGIVAFILLLKEAYLGRREITITKTPHIFLIGILILLAVLSMVLSFSLKLKTGILVDAVGAKAPHIRSIVQTLKFIFASVVFYWMTFNIVRSREILVRSILALLIGAGFAVVWGLYLYLGYVLGFDTALEFKSTWIVARLNATGQEALFFANFLLTTIPMTFFLIFVHHQKRWTIIIWALLYLQLLAMIFTFAAGGWVGLFLAIFVYVLLKPKEFWRQKMKLALVAVLLATTVAGIHYSSYPVAKGFIPLAQKFYTFFASTQDIEKWKESSGYYPSLYSGIDRAMLRETAYRIWQDYPWFGIGLGNYAFLYNDYNPPEDRDRNIVMVTNNQYLSVLVGTGIFGFVVYTVLLIMVVYRTFLAIRQRKHSPEGLFLAAGFSAVLAILLQYMTFNSLSRSYFWILIGIMMAVSQFKAKGVSYEDSDNS